jgi:hypothetical protein
MAVVSDRFRVSIMWIVGANTSIVKLTTAMATHQVSRAIVDMTRSQGFFTVRALVEKNLYFVEKCGFHTTILSPTKLKVFILFV